MSPIGAWMIGHWSFNLSVSALDGHMLRLSPTKSPAAGNRTLALEQHRGQACPHKARPERPRLHCRHLHRISIAEMRADRRDADSR